MRVQCRMNSNNWMQIRLTVTPFFPKLASQDEAEYHHHIPSAHATLPVEIQQLPVSEVYNTTEQYNNSTFVESSQSVNEKKNNSTDKKSVCLWFLVSSCLAMKRPKGSRSVVGHTLYQNLRIRILWNLVVRYNMDMWKNGNHEF